MPQENRNWPHVTQHLNLRYRLVWVINFPETPLFFEGSMKEPMPVLQWREMYEQ